MTPDLDQIALDIARRFTPDDNPRLRAAVQLDILEVLKRHAPIPVAELLKPGEKKFDAHWERPYKGTPNHSVACASRHGYGCNCYLSLEKTDNTVSPAREHHAACNSLLGRPCNCWLSLPENGGVK